MLLLNHEPKEEDILITSCDAARGRCAGITRTHQRGLFEHRQVLWVASRRRSVVTETSRYGNRLRPRFTMLTSCRCSCSCCIRRV